MLHVTQKATAGRCPDGRRSRMPRIWQWSEADRRAGLPKPSLVKVGKLVTIDQRWVRQHLGRVPPTTRHNISTMLRRILEA
jgi:hypothetical protein